MGKLAITGGKPIRTKLFTSQNTIGPLEMQNVARVLEGGVLTGYQGNWGAAHFGGPEIRKLEEEWADKFGVKHAIAINSCTSGLFVACGAVELNNRDVVVTPFSMTCSATAPILWGGEPVFADIERDYYCLNPKEVEKKLNYIVMNAIIAVDLFGQPCDYDALRAEGVYIIEDAAQAIGAKYKGRYAGTLADIGVFSLNLGKHLTAGEGGIIVTDNDHLAFKCRLLMNHAEAVINSANDDNVYNNTNWVARHKHMYGFNLRMTEIQATIARVQLAKMDALIDARVDNVKYLCHGLQDLPCIELPHVRPGCTHTYYVMPLKYYGGYGQEDVSGIHRDNFIEAVKAELMPVEGRQREGVPIGGGYIRPIQNMPLFGRSLNETPECTRQWQDELIILHRFIGPRATTEELHDVIDAFHKVWENKEELYEQGVRG
jgi:dTDP-4-amino-4,6-dideoxygalactose transaminase